MNKCLRVLFAVGAFAVIISPLPAQLQEPRRELTADDRAKIIDRAKARLVDLNPVADEIKPYALWTVIEGTDGSVRWGKLFRPDEVAALVNVYEPEENPNIDPQPKYLSYFVWRNGKWEFQQFLGDAYGLEIHYRKDQPSVFLQGYCRYGKNDGEHFSWYFNKKSGKLVRTDFEDWGPFILKGNYLICGRGFERLSHDGTYWIYEYSNGKKGKRVARYHLSDRGYSDISFPDPKTGKWHGWLFRDDVLAVEKPTEVFLTEDAAQRKEDELTIAEGAPVRKAMTNEELDDFQLFEHLTGLDSQLLENGWTDELPKKSKTQWVPVKAEGDPEIVQVLQGKAE